MLRKYKNIGGLIIIISACLLIACGQSKQQCLADCDFDFWKNDYAYYTSLRSLRCTGANDTNACRTQAMAEAAVSAFVLQDGCRKGCEKKIY